MKRDPDNDLPLMVAITGASGAAYSLALLRELCRAGAAVDLAVSRMGRDLLRREAGIPPDGPLSGHLAERGMDTARIREHDIDDMGAPPSSGSYRMRGMVICPCSAKTLSAVAAGSCRNLIERAAEVTLKERRRLVLVYREAPYSLVQIENMRRVTLAGGLIMPASPAFYHNPSTIDDLLDHVVARVLDHLGLPNEVSGRWDG